VKISSCTLCRDEASGGISTVARTPKRCPCIIIEVIRANKVMTPALELHTLPVLIIFEASQVKTCSGKIYELLRISFVLS
jgi:hypothetical protein